MTAICLSAHHNSTQLNKPPTKVSGLQGERGWKLIRLPDSWSDSRVFFLKIWTLLQRNNAAGQWRRSQVKSGGINIEEWRGGVWGGAMPSPFRGLGACPQKKKQFCADNYAILSKFWYLFPILQHKNLLAHQRKWGELSPVLKVGDLSPFPPCSDAYAAGRLFHKSVMLTEKKYLCISKWTCGFILYVHDLSALYLPQ